MMYHIIAPVNPRSLVPLQYTPPELLDRQCSLLSKYGFHSVTMGQLASGDLPRRPVVLTFDDAYVNFHTAALPILKRYGFTATVFVVTNQIGGSNVWDTALGDVSQPLMNLEQIKDCLANGIEIGGHTVDHLDLAFQSEKSIWFQLDEGKKRLESLTGQPVNTFCYPYGGVNDKVRELTNKAGYKVACTTKRGLNRLSTSDLLMLRRMNCRSNTSVPIYFTNIWRCLLPAS
jgi:peptidoglycan/xylan/chitin deacetylase (PgdA/CDA1 family)